MSAGTSLGKFIKFTVSGLINAGLSGAARVTEGEAKRIDVTRLNIALPHLPRAFDGMTIAQVSDPHMGEWMTLERMQAVVRQVNALHPDVIVLTGDFISVMRHNTPRELTTALRGLHARDGAYAILGNHDYDTDAATVSRAIHIAGNVRLLVNEHAVLKRGGERLYIAGVDDAVESQPDLDAALCGVPDGAPVILLAHEPDIANDIARSGRVGLQLSGHTHGGQIRLPLVGAVILPIMGRKYPMGLYQVDGMMLYVNRGVGMVSIHARFKCPPEITLITLKAS